MSTSFNGQFWLSGSSETHEGGKRVPQSRSRRGGRRDEARAVTRAFTAMIASIPSVDPHRGPVDLSYAAEAREEKPMLPGGKISNLTAKRLRAEIRAR